MTLADELMGAIYIPQHKGRIVRVLPPFPVSGPEIWRDQLREQGKETLAKAQALLAEGKNRVEIGKILGKTGAHISRILATSKEKRTRAEINAQNRASYRKHRERVIERCKAYRASKKK
jgi:hypothetical protein